MSSSSEDEDLDIYLFTLHILGLRLPLIISGLHFTYAKKILQEGRKPSKLGFVPSPALHSSGT